MAYTSSAVEPRHLTFTGTPAPAKRGFFGWLFEAMIGARQRQAEREIARYVANTGKFTDEAEREIERRFLSTPSRW